jgi:HlyD family secretion protein
MAGGVVLVVIVLGLGLRPEPVAVDASAVTRGPLRVTVDEEGRTQVRERFVISAPVGGRVTRIDRREGDRVTRNDIVARIFPAPLDPRERDAAMAQLSAAEDACSSATAAASRARAALDQARRDRERVEQLTRQAIGTPEQLELARLAETSREREFESADFAAQAARHQVEMARAALSGDGPDGAQSFVVRAPVTGVVLRIPERSERVVAAGAPLLEVGDPGGVEVVTELLSADAVRIGVGAPAWIEGWGGDSALAARVRTIEPSGFTKVSALGVEEQRVRVILDPLTTPASLADGYRGQVRIVVWESGDVVKVPVSALFRQGASWAVFVVAKGRAAARRVEIGHRNPFDAEVAGGVAAGDLVILHPGDRLSDGAKVSVR